MKKVVKLLEQVSDKLELPADVIAGVPRIELIGAEQCSVEPHKGLLEYTAEQIVVATSLGDVAVLGENLQIKKMNLQRITICGRVSGIVLNGGVHE